ncbi:MAG: hypothetical protein ACXV78_06420, partial [Candidatus Angelobacter sp.]
FRPLPRLHRIGNSRCREALLEKHGFKNVQARRIPDRSPTPETYSGKWFKNADELRDFKRIGALLLIAEK